MNEIKCNFDNLNELFGYKEAFPEVLKAVKKIEDASGEGCEYLGWLDLPTRYDNDEFRDIIKISDEIKEEADILLVIGIGGSYLGARCAIESQNGVFQSNKDNVKVYFLGINLSADYIEEILNIIKGKSVYVNVISKSGTTLEPAIAFRIMRDILSKKYPPSELKRRIIVTTDKTKGILKEISNKEGYRTFIVPDDVGGRYSVLTSVGLLPIAVAGIDINEMMLGAKKGKEIFSKDNNDCYRYASARVALYHSGYEIEVFTNYNPRFTQFSEWLKQLFGESEGKNGKGLFPASMTFTTDLHSLGQYVQDGKKILFKTELDFEKKSKSIKVPCLGENSYDKLNYLSGKSIDDLNEIAQKGVYLAHKKGGVPQITVKIPENNPYYLGMLFYFFEKACALSAYAIGVNPFDQLGVEEYKKQIKILLEKI